MIFEIAKKELRSMFASPMGWVILALMQFAFGTYYLILINQYVGLTSAATHAGGRAGVTIFVGQSVFNLAALFLLFSVPLLSMRLIADERRNLTLPFLFSAPLSLTDIVIGKFVGLIGYLSILIAFVTAMLLTLCNWTEPDFGFLIANILGLCLLVGSFSALGLYCSSITTQPVTAAMLTFVALLSLLSLDQYDIPKNNDFTQLILEQFSLMHHFEAFSQGMIDSTDVTFFLLFTSTFLILTMRRLDAERLHA